MGNVPPTPLPRSAAPVVTKNPMKSNLAVTMGDIPVREGQTLMIIFNKTTMDNSLDCSSAVPSVHVKTHMIAKEKNICYISYITIIFTQNLAFRIQYTEMFELTGMIDIKHES